MLVHSFFRWEAHNASDTAMTVELLFIDYESEHLLWPNFSVPETGSKEETVSTQKIYKTKCMHAHCSSYRL